jgi:hypothetical protein
MRPRSRQRRTDESQAKPLISLFDDAKLRGLRVGEAFAETALSINRTSTNYGGESTLKCNNGSLGDIRLSCPFCSSQISPFRLLDLKYVHDKGSCTPQVGELAGSNVRPTRLSIHKYTYHVGHSTPTAMQF